MDYFPFFLALRGRRVLVVGGGEIAARKVRLLRRAGARIRVLAPRLCAELDALATQGALDWQAAPYSAAAIDADTWFVLAATDDEAVNAQVAADAERARLWVNVVDDPRRSSAITPAIVDRNPLLVALSSGGRAPVYIRQLRARLERELPPRLGELLEWLGTQRARIAQAIPDMVQRLRVWERIVDGPVASRALAGDTAAADAALGRLLEAEQGAPQGEVWLVGAGPGDPDLLTLKALRRMQQADVVVHDRLLGPQILDLVRRDAERIDAGKRRSRHTLPQEDINALLVRLAREGKRVLRLKGGDPFVFGRGGEEIAELLAAGVPFEVIPGITAANGAAAYAGMPLTHRDHAQSCVFVTGHPRADGALSLPWATLVPPGQTVVIYMGLTRLEDICAQLIAHGAPAQRPAAMVENASRAEQRVIVGDLATLPQKVAQAQPEGPGLVIIGEVVRLRAQLSWWR